MEYPLSIQQSIPRFNMSIIALIPARKGSKGLPGKNIKPLGGRPLLAYSIKAALGSKKINRVILSTDSEEYAEIGVKYGAEVPFLRPEKMAEDHSPDIEWLEHALDWFLQKGESLPRLIVHLRPTTPLRDTSIIDKAIQMIEEDESASALRSVQEMSQTAYKSFEIKNGYLACLCTQAHDIETTNQARQKFPKTFEPNGYVDVLKTDFIINSKKMHGHRAIAYQTPRVSEVDAAEDFDYLEYQLTRNVDLINNLFGSEK